MKITTKLTTLLLLLSIAPMLLVSLLVYRSSRQSIEQNARNRLMSITLLKEAEFTRWLSDHEDTMLSLAQRPQVRDLAQALVTQPQDSPGFEQAYDNLLNAHFRFFIDNLQNYESLFLLHRDTAEVLIATDPALEGTRNAEAPFFLEGRTRTFVDAPAFEEHAGTVAMHVSTPVASQDGDLIAVLAGHVNLAEMTAIMRQDLGDTRTQETYLIDRNRLFVTASRSSPEHQFGEQHSSRGIDNCLQQQNGTAFYDDYRDVPVIGAYRWIPERELCIVTEVDQAEALAPVITLRNRVIAIGVGTTIVIGLLGALIARAISGPVLELAHGAEAITRGNLDYRVDVASRDEIGTLARAFNDMTAALRSSQTGLRQERDFVDAVLDTSSALTIVLDRDGRIVRFNRQAEVITGQTFAEVRNRPLWALFSPSEEAEAVRAAFTGLRAGCPTASHESRWIMPDGSETLIAWRNTGMVGPDGEVAYIIWTGIDITEREAAKRALQDLNETLEQRIVERTRELEESEQRLRRTIMNAPVPIMLHAEGEVLLVNEMWTAITGYTRDEIPTTAAWAEIGYGPRKAWASGVIDNLYSDDGSVVDQEVTVLTRRGDERIWQFRAAPLGRLPDGRRMALSMAMDVTERHQAERAIRESEANLRGLVNAIFDSVLLTGADGTIIIANEAVADRLGDTVEALTGKNFFELFDPAVGSNRLRHAQQVIATGLPAHFEDERLGRQMENSIYPIFAPSGRVTRLAIYARDITDLTQARLELARHAEELERSNEELQQFAYVASHDLQEPLRMVTSYLQLLERRYKHQLDRDADEFIAFAVDGANRMKRLITDLLTYSRVGTRGKSFQPVSCERAIEQARQNLQLMIEDSHAQVVYRDLPTVMADEGQLVQLFQNLIANAIKFRREDVPPVIEIGAGRQEDAWMLFVRDNGIGIDTQFSERIFVIFERLHPIHEYGGTGIGLAVCKKIVERHGGRIWVESTPGQGSTFYFTFPVRGALS